MKLQDIFLPADDKLEIRLAKKLKSELKREAAQKGFPTLSKYILALLIQRGEK